MFTQHQNKMRTMATLAVFTVATFTAVTQADFAVSDTGPYISNDDILVFDGDDAIDAFIGAAVHHATLADLLGNERGGDAIDLALGVAGDDMGFYSLASALIALENGEISESDLNVDAHRVTDWVQQRLLNAELEVQVGASIFKVMGDSIVEITDGDAATLEWLRDIQQTRREIHMEGYESDTDVSWLSGSADNVIVHEWRVDRNVPGYEEFDGSGMTQQMSTPAPTTNRPGYEEFSGNGMTQHMSTPAQDQGGREYEEAGGNGLPQFLSTPAPQTGGRTYEEFGAGEIPQHMSSPSGSSRRPAYEEVGSDDLLSNE